MAKKTYMDVSIDKLIVKVDRFVLFAKIKLSCLSIRYRRELFALRPTSNQFLGIDSRTKLPTVPVLLNTMVYEDKRMRYGSSIAINSPRYILLSPRKLVMLIMSRIVVDG